MKLNKVKYDELNHKQKEIYNFHIVASLLAEYGFNSIRLSDDWQGADFLAYHKDGDHTLKVQLKGRMTVDKKYIGKDLYMCFPIGTVWHLLPHDELLNIVGETIPETFETDSWIRGTYSWRNPSNAICEKLAEYALDPD